uniref:MFS transporter n=1 Tax=Thermocrispum agreste TaxID=37925 RepID=A0A2W4L038_9PSEU|nr:MAG: hypothetical protein DIU77_14540 [Thermocrispum agreste]
MATAIVTGTASGGGEALADKVVLQGLTARLADLDTDGAARVAERLGSRAFARRLDVTDAAAVQALVDEVDAEHGLDLMVNNAGIAVGGAADELGLEHWNRCIDVNLRGVVHGAHAAYLKMKARGRGQILNTASLAGLVVSPLTGPYTATKHAVVALSLSLRAEAALHGVQVSVLCPGVIDTPIFAQANDRLPQTAVAVVAHIGLGVILALFLGPNLIAMLELFPTRVRYTGFSLGYNFAVSAFGGTAPFLVTFVITRTGITASASFYLILAALVSIAVILLMPETAPRRRSAEPEPSAAH